MTKPTIAAELKPCPFCGSTPNSRWWGVCGEDDDGGFWGIDCPQTCAQSHEDSEEEAAARWNTRTHEAIEPSESVDTEHPAFNSICREIERICPDLSAGMRGFLAGRVLLLVNRTAPTASDVSGLGRKLNAAQLSSIIQDWLDADDATHFGAFEKALAAAVQP